MLRLTSPGKFGVIADDLTGAGDTGLQYQSAGLRTRIVTSFPGGEVGSFLPSVQVWVVNAGSRHLSPLGAGERVSEAARWLLRRGCQNFYLKVDSTLRGNIPSQIAALMTRLKSDLAVVAPAFPSAGRTTIGGFQLVNGHPVALTVYGDDPLAPVAESHLPTLLEASRLGVGTIDLRTVLLGWESLAGALIEAHASGQRVVVVDAAQTADLGTIAAAIARLDHTRLLPVGSAGLAAALRETIQPQTPHLLKSRRHTRRLIGRTAPILVVSGSPNPTTLDQIKHLGTSERLVLLDVPHLLLKDPDPLEPLASELAKATRQAAQALLANRDVVVTTALSVDQVSRDRELGRELGMTTLQVAAKLSNALGTIARELHNRAVLGGLVITGGETAGAVCRALGIWQLDIIEEVVPAVPLMLAVGTNLRLVTKSGGFGALETLRIVIEQLRQTVPMGPPIRRPHGRGPEEGRHPPFDYVNGIER